MVGEGSDDITRIGMRRRDDDLERSRRDDCERRRRDRAVGDGEDTGPDVEDDDRARRNQIGASDGVEDPTPAARGLTGVEKVCFRRCFGNRV